MQSPRNEEVKLLNILGPRQLLIVNHTENTIILPMYWLWYVCRHRIRSVFTFALIVLPKLILCRMCVCVWGCAHIGLCLNMWLQFRSVYIPVVTQHDAQCYNMEFTMTYVRKNRAGKINFMITMGSVPHIKNIQLAQWFTFKSYNWQKMRRNICDKYKIW